MRSAIFASILVLLAGCMSPTTHHREQSSSATETVNATPPPTAAAPPVNASGPAPGPKAQPAAVLTWIEAAQLVDTANFNTVELDGTTTDLGVGEVAFRLPATVPYRTLTGCVSYHWTTQQFSCLGGVRNAPPQPPGMHGEWIPSWVDFDGKTVDIGSLHGDPGPFNNSNGRPLEYGTRIKFGDYQCRSDPAGMYCANYPHHSAIQLWGTSFIAFGCNKDLTAPHGVGERFTCKQS